MPDIAARHQARRGTGNPELDKPKQTPAPQVSIPQPRNPNPETPVSKPGRPGPDVAASEAPTVKTPKMPGSRPCGETAPPGGGTPSGGTGQTRCGRHGNRGAVAGLERPRALGRPQRQDRRLVDDTPYAYDGRCHGLGRWRQEEVVAGRRTRSGGGHHRPGDVGDVDAERQQIDGRCRSGRPDAETYGRALYKVT